MTARAPILQRCWPFAAAAAVLGAAVSYVSPLHMAALPPGMRTPVLAFELARSVAEVEAMFGAAASLERDAWSAGMRLGVWLDFGLLAAYAALLAAVARTLLPAAPRVRVLFAIGFPVAAAAFDVLEDRELLQILDGLGGGAYAGAVVQLIWFTWAKWWLLALWFALLVPALWRAGGSLRIAAGLGAIAALSAPAALLQRGAAAEAMAFGIMLGITAIGLASLRDAMKRRREAPARCH